MSIWLLILALGLGTVAAKVTGPLAAGGRQPPERVTGVIALLTPALLAALIVTGTFATDRDLHVDARAPGLAVAAVLLLLRVPVALSLIAAAAATATIRAVF
jgi:hypothetical protein